MSDISKRAPGCDDGDDDGERGERGKRGRRGRAGETGSTGPTGPAGDASLTGATGPTGPTGATGPTVISGNNFVFRPGGVDGGNVFTTWAPLVAAMALVQGYKTLQFDNSIAPCVIPAGVWDMTQVEWLGYFTGAGGVGPSVTISDGAAFTNLRKIGGELGVINANTVAAPIVIAPLPGAAAVFEFGSGITGDFPQLNNTGGAPFIDISALLAGSVFVLRVQGVITGTAPAIQYGASPAAILLTIYDAARIQSGMIIGTNPAAQLQVFNFGTGGQLNRQSGFAGTITYGRPNSFTGLPAWPRFWMFPASVNQGPTAPSAAAFTPATGLGMNACLRFNTTAGDIAQTLPIIRAAAPPIGSFSTTPGALESTGLVVIIKNELGGGDVIVSPDVTTPDTIDSGVGPVIVPAGTAKIFISDGVSNWSAVP